MKVSDPIIFGQAVGVLLEDFVAKHDDVLRELGMDYNLGLSDLEERIAALPAQNAPNSKPILRRALPPIHRFTW